MMIEEWKDIQGYEGKYQVSSNGKVKSFKRSKIGALMKISFDNRGYPKIGLSINNKQWVGNVHQLVAKAFVDGYSTGMQVNHIDGDKLNNNCTNLEWCTLRENMQHAHKTGLICHSNQGSNHGMSVISDETARKVKVLLREGFRNSEIMKLLELKYWIVSDIKSGKTWKHIVV